jgi:uncharacterized membrane protein YtjA (UPF0391 family)
MLGWTIALFVIALVCGVFGFVGLAASAAWTAKVLFYVFLVGGVFSLLTGMARQRR